MLSFTTLSPSDGQRGCNENRSSADGGRRHSHHGHRSAKSGFGSAPRLLAALPPQVHGRGRFRRRKRHVSIERSQLLSSLSIESMALLRGCSRAAPHAPGWIWWWWWAVRPRPNFVLWERVIINILSEPGGRQLGWNESSLPWFCSLDRSRVIFVRT